jgi:hypothetical protein
MSGFPAFWLSLVAGLGGEEQDVVVLENGKELEGRVVYDDGKLLILRQGTRDSEIAMADVQRVDSLVRRQDALLDRELAAPPWDLAEARMLAEQARESGLEGEARVFAWRMLAVDAANEDAHLFLDHKQRSSGWSVPMDGRAPVRFEKRAELARDWSDAWEFSTLHYELKTNLPLVQALDLPLDMERLYQGFFALFAADLRLFEILEPMRVHVHADEGSYPESGREAGRYDPDDDTLRIDASAGLDPGILAHEATHQLLHDTAVRERSYSGEIPGWLDEGLADYIAGCVVGPRGRLVVEPGRAHELRFRAHASAEKELSLSRVLNLTTEDFWASSRQDLKYAQACTLVHFCLHGEDGRHRAAFLDFLRDAYRGQASSTDFKKRLGARDEREFEAAWRRHVQTIVAPKKTGPDRK